LEVTKCASRPVLAMLCRKLEKKEEEKWQNVGEKKKLSSVFKM